MNLPNSITLARIACLPLFLWILSGAGSRVLHGRQELPAVAVLLLAWGSGAVDGQIARRTHQVTKLGTLLSALTDRLLVSTAFIALLRFAPALLPAWIAVLIVGREFLVTGLRAVATQERMELDVCPSTPKTGLLGTQLDLGKAMTAVQTISVLCLLLAHRWPSWQLGGAKLPGVAIASGVLWTMLTISLVSAAAYFCAFWIEARNRHQGRARA